MSLNFNGLLLLTTTCVSYLQQSLYTNEVNRGQGRVSETHAPPGVDSVICWHATPNLAFQETSDVRSSMCLMLLETRSLKMTPTLDVLASPFRPFRTGIQNKLLPAQELSYCSVAMSSRMVIGVSAYYWRGFCFSPTVLSESIREKKTISFYMLLTRSCLSKDFQTKSCTQ